MILLRYAHTRRPVYYLRLSSIRQLNSDTPFCSLYRAPTPRPTTQAQGAKGTQGPRGPKGSKGPEGGQGDPRDPRAPSAPLGGGGPWGPLGVIPKPFRMEGHFERKGPKGALEPLRVIPELFRMASHFEWMAISNGRPLRADTCFGEVLFRMESYPLSHTVRGFAVGAAAFALSRTARRFADLSL